MATYEKDGTLTTDKKSGDTFGWDTQTEWEAYQSKTDIEILNGNLQLGEAIPESGISKWEFEQDYTDSWNGNDGSPTGSQFVTDSQQGTYAVETDGVDDYIDFGDFDATYSFSLSAYIKINTFNQYTRIISLNYSSGNHAGFALNDNTGNGQLVWLWQEQDGSRTDSDNVTTTNDLSTGTWYHIVCTFAGGDSGTIYVDGSDDTGSNSTNWSGVEGDGSGGFRIGKPVYDSRAYDAIFDDVRVYDKELSATEVSNLYNNGSI